MPDGAGTREEMRDSCSGVVVLWHRETRERIRDSAVMGYFCDIETMSTKISFSRLPNSPKYGSFSNQTQRRMYRFNRCQPIVE